MINKRVPITFFSYIFCIAVCSFTQNINSFFFKNLFIQSDISYTEIDLAGSYQIFGYIIAPGMLILASKAFSSLKIIIFSITIYITSSLISSHLLSSPDIINFCAMTMAGSNLVIIILLLSRLAVGSHNNKVNPGYLVFFSWILGYLLGEIMIIFFADFIQANFIFLIINTILLSIIVFNVLINPQFVPGNLASESRFNIIVRNTRLESMTVFVIFYILILIADGYEYYALIEHLLVFTAGEDDCYAFVLMLGIIHLTRNIYKQYNPYIINLFCLFMLLTAFITMPVWGHYYWISAALWLFIGVLMYTLFSSGILILIEKFENTDLHFAILIFSLMGSLGFYAGYIVSRKSEYRADESGFLYSLCFVILSLIIYYLLRFKKDKLMRW